jgi:hypothetical protein
MKTKNKLIHPNEFNVGDVYQHPEFGAVYVESGCYLDPVYQRVSNHWTFRKVNKNGKLGKRFSEYGQSLKELKYSLVVKVHEK